MSSAQRRRVSGGPVAVLALVLLPALAHAETIHLRNDTSITVVVNVSSVARGRIFRAQPRLLNPKTTGRFVLPGTKVITLYDARFPTRVLYQGTIPASPLNSAYSIQPDVPPRLKLIRVP